MMNHISLFSGIGGFDLASKWMGWKNIAHCEINPFCLKILKYYWPNAATHTDIKSTDFTVYRGKCDILTGGFPCQPYSVAGQRKGKEDDRHLWPEMFRAIQEIQPTWVVGENVSGLINWNGGMVFDEVQADLEAAGYEVIPFILPACSVNAPHKRERIWFVAYASSISKQQRSNKRRKQKPYKRESKVTGTSTNGINSATTNTGNFRLQTTGNTWKRRAGFKDSNSDANATNPNSAGRQECNVSGITEEPEYDSWRNHKAAGNWQNFPTVSPVCERNDEFSDKLSGITFSKWRNESIKALGNAVVPAVVFQIFKSIEQFKNQ